MRARRIARRLALDVLYEAEIRGQLPTETFEDRQGLGWYTGAPTDASEEDDFETPEAPSEEILGYARALVEGVQAHHADADELIVRYADRWAIERMPVIDRNLIRMALFEILWGDRIPVAVAVNEAVELAKALSTEDSGRFINGLLGRIIEEVGAP
ncbi:MAG: transcription antitermination factor NusB [Actinomycetota bacterium]